MWNQRLNRDDVTSVLKSQQCKHDSLSGPSDRNSAPPDAADCTAARILQRPQHVSHITFISLKPFITKSIAGFILFLFPLLFCFSALKVFQELGPNWGHYWGASIESHWPPADTVTTMSPSHGFLNLSLKTKSYISVISWCIYTWFLWKRLKTLCCWNKIWTSPTNF